MKKKATRRAAKATSRQSTLNFPTSPEADLVAESTAAVTSMKSGMKNRTKRTEDVADKGSESLGDSSAISAIKTPRLRQTHSKSSDPMEQNEIALDKKRSGAELGQEFQNTLINHVAKADGELPRSWTRALLGEMVDIKYGKNLPTSAFTEHGYPVFGANGIIGNYDRYLYNEPQVLISCRGAYSGRINLSPPQCFITNNSLVLEIADSQTVLRDYLYYALQTVDRSKLVTGSAQPQVTINNAEILVIPLAPFPEQHRIVAEIEKQFTRLDAGVAALKRVQANLKRYRAAVLKAACEGKLVPTEAELANRGGTNFQSGAELLATISDLEANDLNPRRAGRLWGAGHVPDLTDEERLSLPDGWVWAKVRELGFDPENAVQVGPMSMKSSDFTDAGTPVLNVGCVQWGRFVESKLDHLPAEKASEFERYRIKCGDVLFTRSGTVGRCAVAQPHQDGWLMTFHLLRARANPEKCLPSFLRIVFEGAPHIRRQTREASVGSTRAGFNTNLLGNLAIPLPPLAEQTRIVAEVERRLSVVDELEAVVSANLQRANRLRQSILQKAFTGELTGDGTCLRDSQASVERVVSRQAAGVAVSPTPAARR